MNIFTKSELQHMLSNLDDDSLFSLTATITKRLLPKNKIDCRQGAIDAIINYSPDAISILNRKILTKEILFAYAHMRRLPIKLPASKNNLIERILSFWDTNACLENVPGNLENDMDYIPIPEENQQSQQNLSSVSLLAEQFAKWFYSLMNKKECIDTSHFYMDAKLKINITGNGDIVTELVENDPQGIVEKLFTTKMNFNLFFNPNMSPQGVQGRIDPHGIVIILACGTLHVDDVCKGVFEQVFGLVRDPVSENNWRIKFTELNLNSGILGQPTLCDNELTSSFLSLPPC